MKNIFKNGIIMQMTISRLSLDWTSAGGTRPSRFGRYQPFMTLVRSKSTKRYINCSKDWSNNLSGSFYKPHTIKIR